MKTWIEDLRSGLARKAQAVDSGELEFGYFDVGWSVGWRNLIKFLPFIPKMKDFPYLSEVLVQIFRAQEF